MGVRGPPPKPPEQKRLEGTYTARRDAEREAVAVPVEAPECPAELNAEARRVWNEVVPDLLALGTLAKTDRGVLQGYCMTLARAVAYEAKADKEPLLETQYGQKLNPLAGEARKLWQVVQKLAVDLGLSYAARSRTPPPKKANAADPVERDLFGGPGLTSIPGGKAGA